MIVVIGTFLLNSICVKGPQSPAGVNGGCTDIMLLIGLTRNIARQFIINLKGHPTFHNEQILFPKIS